MQNPSKVSADYDDIASGAVSDGVERRVLRRQQCNLILSTCFSRRSAAVSFRAQHTSQSSSGGPRTSASRIGGSRTD